MCAVQDCRPSSAAAAPLQAALLQAGIPEHRDVPASCLGSAAMLHMPRLFSHRPTSNPQQQESFRLAYLIVDHHDGDQRSVRPNGVLQLLQVNKAIFLDGQVGHIEATVLQVARAVQHTPAAGPGGCSAGETCRGTTLA